ncbi:MAG: hypothetical protein M1814_006801 [Vezdaea aestivalis]|nr:MAG: hypothetical protein M1814_006801 [Vezdaea aestivalis]
MPPGGTTGDRLGKRPPDTRISPPPLKRKIQSTTTSSALASFFKPVSQKGPGKTQWATISQSLLIVRHDGQARHPFPSRLSKAKIAAFDFDGTLVSTKSGKTHSSQSDDWAWWRPEVPAVLEQLHEDGFHVIVFSNQAGITLDEGSKKSKGTRPTGTGEKRLKGFKQKVSTVLGQLDIPVMLLAATERDRFRKPCTGMWDEMLIDYHLNLPGSVDLQASFFVGDAGGRVANGKIKKDFSCSDRNFAANIGIHFYTPEEFFLKEGARDFKRDFDPVKYLEATETEVYPEVPKPSLIELVLFCGSPGSGKSTFYWTRFQPAGYERVNQDISKTRDRCIEAARAYLLAGKSVVVDNTNADKNVRSIWINLAAQLQGQFVNTTTLYERWAQNRLAEIPSSHR